jgi:hypothetical protein
MAFTLGAFALALFAGCGDDDSDSGTPTAAASVATAPNDTPTPSPTPTEPGPMATPSGPVEAPSTVQLVDVATVDVTTLYVNLDATVYSVEFEGAGVRLRAGQETFEFDFDGDPVSVDPDHESPFETCVELGMGGSIVCGSLSPNGSWLTYAVDAGTVTIANGAVLPAWDQWAMNVETGQPRLLQEGLVHCGGCDWFHGPRWSPSSRYVAFSEYRGEERRFLADVTTAETRQIGTGSGRDEAPVWSRAADLLLYRESPGGPTILEDLPAGTTRVLDLTWPATFDESGAFIYSPAWIEDPSAPGAPETTLVGVVSGAASSRLPGAPPRNFLWTDGRAVADTPAGLVAALQYAESCDGTAVYLEGALATCVVHGAEGQIGSDGSVAVARQTGIFGRMNVYDIDIVGPEGQVETVVTGALSYHAPLMKWNAEGTHLLVQWPRFVGL